MDVAVVGGGIVGLATAWSVQQARPRSAVVVLEKEAAVATHQTGHNSGVIHSGVYYAPGSVKARTCVAGREALLGFCRAHDIAHDLTGKVIVATTTAERARLHGLARRAAAGGVRSHLVGPAGLRRLEPHARGREALHVPGAGIVDFVAVAQRLAVLLADGGGRVRCGAEVVSLAETSDHVRIATTQGDVTAGVVVNCAGLHSDRVAESALGRPPSVRIVPFRGEYHRLAPHRVGLCRGLIYPVPDPRFPFLGVHLTRTVTGEVLVGPNAVLALSREGYRWGDVDAEDLRDLAAHPGLRRLARAHWGTGLAEMGRSVSTAAFARALRRLVPEITTDDLRPAAAGVRAQAVRPDGSLVDDFVIEATARSVHVLNAPSPAATAALAIGAEVAGQVVDRLA